MSSGDDQDDSRRQPDGSNVVTSSSKENSNNGEGELTEIPDNLPSLTASPDLRTTRPTSVASFRMPSLRSETSITSYSASSTSPPTVKENVLHQSSPKHLSISNVASPSRKPKLLRQAASVFAEAFDTTISRISGKDRTGREEEENSKTSNVSGSGIRHPKLIQKLQKSSSEPSSSSFRSKSDTLDVDDSNGDLRQAEPSKGHCEAIEMTEKGKSLVTAEVDIRNRDKISLSSTPSIDLSPPKARIASTRMRSLKRGMSKERSLNRGESTDEDMKIISLNNSTDAGSSLDSDKDSKVCKEVQEQNSSAEQKSGLTSRLKTSPFLRWTQHVLDPKSVRKTKSVESSKKDQLTGGTIQPPESPKPIHSSLDSAHPPPSSTSGQAGSSPHRLNPSLSNSPHVPSSPKLLSPSSSPKFNKLRAASMTSMSVNSDTVLAPILEEKEKTIKNKETEVNDDSSSIKNILGIHIHNTDRKLKSSKLVLHPVVKVHVMSISTGRYLVKKHTGRNVVSYYETVDYILPIMTAPCDLVKYIRYPRAPIWEELLVYNEDYDYFLREDVILIFEVSLVFE